MSNATKIESMLEFMCDDVCNVIASNLEIASIYVDKLSYLKDIEDAFELAAKDNGKNIKMIVDASSISDIFWVLCHSILADDDVEDAELEQAADLIKDSLYRYCWLKDYKKYKYLSDADDARNLLSQWQNDASWFGGDKKKGAIVRPFNDFVILACFIEESPALYQMYSKTLLLIARIILESDGVTTDEQAFYDSLSSSLYETESFVRMAVVSSNSSEDGNLEEDTSQSEQTEIRQLKPEDALKQGLEDLNFLVGIDSVKAEVVRLANFLKIRQQRLTQGMSVPSQSLHFVFTGNPGTGKTTVARIIAKILYGFQILKTANFVETDRSTMVGGYIGHTAIKTNEAITKAIDGVLFIDEAYSLAKSSGEDFGQEAIETLLKKMEDLRDRLVVIVAGYPKEIASFIASNPGLESRFTRYIHFEDYHVADLCQIFDRMCAANDYHLTPAARGNLAIIFNRAFINRDQNFGNARFVRNAYERTLGNHSDRLATSDQSLTRDMLSTIESVDLPYDLAEGINSPLDLAESRWQVQCPKCEKTSSARLQFLGQIVKCKCGARFRCPWWNLDPKTVPGLVEFEKFERPMDRIGYDMQDLET